jgi:hypothetical protein
MFADVFLPRRLETGLPYARRSVSLNDCASAIIYSRRRKVFLEAHWAPAGSRRGSYRTVADLGRIAMDYREACGGVSQKMICTLTQLARAQINAALI